MTDKQEKRSVSRLGRRPYHSPRFFVYGEFNELTRAKDFASMTEDGATGTWWLIMNVPLKS
jgi:hypothetical protein